MDPPNKYPSLARLRLADTSPEVNETSTKVDQPINEFICNAVVINEGWVLTATHCIRETEFSEYRVLVGRYNRSVPEEGEQEIKAVQIFYHPNITLPDG